MTYNRMEAKPIAGEHCRFCGDAEAPLVKTPCCEQWICCDTAFVSLRGGGYCQVEHERFSLCYSHYQDQHGGPWESCQKCRDFWSPQDYKFYAENPINGPSAPTMLKTGVGKRRDLTDTALYQEVSHEQEVYRPTFG
jgi:hypothetical protein